MAGYQQVSKNIGPGEVTFDPDGTPVILTPAEMVEITFATNTEAVRQDVYGDFAVSYVTTGMTNPEIKINMCSVSGSDDTEDRLAQVYGITKSTDEYRLKDQPGYDLRDDAKKLVIKPIANGVVNTDKKTWTIIPVCTKPFFDGFKHTYGPKGQRYFGVKCYGLPDLATGIGVIWGENVVI